jgi:hypothetical protein
VLAHTIVDQEACPHCCSGQISGFRWGMVNEWLCDDCGWIWWVLERQQAPRLHES